jgi:pimeloyl-ACP methyl ester carboxylesterase
LNPEETLFMLVHDAWLGAWSWEKVAEWLSGRGWNVAPLDLPAHGVYQIPEERLKTLTLRHYAATVVGVARANPDLSKLVLVGHGSAGPVIQLAAEQLGERVAGLVFVGAYVLQEGESILSQMPPDLAESFKNLAATRPDNRIDLNDVPDFWRYNLINDDPLHAEELLTRLVPEPFVPLNEPVQFKTASRQNLPSAYISFNEDMSLPPGDFYPRMANKLGKYQHLNINSGHEGILTKPREVAEALVLLASQVF